ncbi:MAG: glutamine amidotransferase [Hyphomicrobiales bacterium]|nr:glutamine amidotransferase [Hyphomicrobiales bacterium]
MRFVRPARSPGRQPVLMILHQEHSTPGRVGRFLIERGYPLDIRRPRYGDPLPATMAHHAGAIIFGGPMSANDPDDFVRLETEWIGTVLREAAPYLGICLGAQMLASHLGARVYAHHEGRAEIGYYPLTITDHGAAAEARLSRPWPRHVYQWHREGFDCPTGAICLATGGDFPIQAIQAGNAAYGIQFHPEVTPAMMYRWTTRAHERMAMPGAQPRDAHLEGWHLHDAAVAAWLNAFLDHWLALKEPA